MNIRVVLLGLIVFACFRFIQLAQGLDMMWRIIWSVVCSMFLTMLILMFRSRPNRIIEEDEGEFVIVEEVEEAREPPLMVRIYLKMKKILHM